MAILNFVFFFWAMKPFSKQFRIFSQFWETHTNLDNFRSAGRNETKYSCTYLTLNNLKWVKCRCESNCTCTNGTAVVRWYFCKINMKRNEITEKESERSLIERTFLKQTNVKRKIMYKACKTIEFLTNFYLFHFHFIVSRVMLTILSMNFIIKKQWRSMIK